MDNSKSFNEVKTRQQVNFMMKINLLVLSIIFIVVITPVISRNLDPIYNIILLSLWVVTAVLANINYFTKIHYLSISIIVWIIYLFLIRFLMYLDSSIGNMYQYILFFFFAYAMNFYLELNNKKVLLWIVRLFFIIVSINMITNIYQISGDIYLSKYITSVHTDQDLFYSSNIGNVSFMFSITLCIISWTHFLTQNKKIYNKVIFLTLIISGVYLIYLASSMITLFVLIYMLMTYIFFRTIKRSTERLLFLIFSGVLIILLFFFKNQAANLLIALSNQMNNNLLSDRLIRVASWLDLGQLFNNATSRPTLYLLSLETFLKNPLFGKGMIHENFYSLRYIGMHSQIFDDLARYGVVGLMFYVTLFKLYHNNFKRFSKKRIYSLYLASLLGIFVYSLLNPSINSNSGAVIGIFLFLILPCQIYIESNNFA